MWPWKSNRTRPQLKDLRVLYNREWNRWERLSVNPAPMNRERAERGVQNLYKHSGVPAPQCQWFESPPDFLEALFWLRERQPGRELWYDLRIEQSELFTTIAELYLGEQNDAQMQAAVQQQMRSRFETFNRGTLLQALEQEMRPRLPRLTFVSPPATFSTTVEDAMEMLPALGALALARGYEASRLTLTDRMHTCLNIWRELAETCWWIWPCETECLLCERPTGIWQDVGRLHRINGPAMTFRDGWQIFAWHGVSVPREIIEHPETITREQIDREANLELRRILIERYGEERYLEETASRILQSDTYGTLYRRTVPGQEPTLMVRVVNSTPEPDGSYKIYRLRVPPWIRTARQAVAWTFDLPESLYSPQQET